MNAVVSHGCILEEFVTIAPGAILCGDVRVEDDALIGAGAVILHTDITIGARAKVGAGAVVTQDVPPGATVVGNPARIVKVDP
jgi:UDP-perosamine 4-acetyltransferase